LEEEDDALAFLAETRILVAFVYIFRALLELVERLELLDRFELVERCC
jgi:hypothetical protein